MLQRYSHVFVLFNALSGHRGCPSQPPPAPPPIGFRELMTGRQTIDLDRPLDLPIEMRIMDDEFNNLVHDIDVCTERFMQLQTNMTTALDRYKGCRLVGMDAHMLGRLVVAIIDVGLTISQVEILQQCLLDLYLIENDMWEATQAIEPHLDYLLHLDSEAMVNHVYDNTEENLPITPLLEACQIAQPVGEERGMVEPTMGKCTIDDEFNYLASEIDEVTGQFMRLLSQPSLAPLY